MSNGKSKTPTEKITRGSGNVFADLGLPHPDERLAKAQIAHRICDVVQKNNLTQSEAAKRLGVDQPKVSALLRGRLAGFSMERLFHFLNKLGLDVNIIIARAKHHEAAVNVLPAVRMN